MATLTLNFTAPLNVSCQVGDTAYYVDTETSGSFTVNKTNVNEIGTITQVVGATTNSPNIVCDTTLPGTLHGKSYFVLFSKDAKANEGTVLGYYGEFVFHNNSKSEAEMFMSACDVSQSS